MKLPGTNFTISAGTLAMGAAAVFLAPIVLPVATSALKTVLKTGLKTGMIAYDRSKELVAETRGSLSDVVQEARSEVASETKAQSGKTAKSAKK
jgi:hypothetical protein